MPENNDYTCKVCGKHFSEEDDYKNHGEQDHPEVNEAYPDLFNKKEEPREEKEAEEFNWSEVPEEEWDDVVLRKVNGDKEEEAPAEEIDQQIDKPVQSHDDWVKELEGLQDEFSKEGGTGSGPQEGGKPALLPEQVARAGDPHYNPFKATPPSERLQTDPALSRTTEDAPKEDELIWNTETHHYEKAKEQEEEDDNKDEINNSRQEAEEEGDSSGADDPLAKVADLAESYRYMSRDSRSSLFESLKFTQGDSAILAGLEWNELTRPVKVEASEAYVKGQEEPEEEAEETEEDEENKAYENLYNLEKYHSSPDYKKKSLTCNRCNEAFYNTNDRNIHYNDVHATEQDYKLPETCPYCNIEINEPDNLDWHMQEEHGAHVPSQYTQTGLQGAMADTDFDSLESRKKAGEALDQQDKDHLELLKSGRIDGVHDPQREDAIKELESRESHKKGNENELDLCPICQDGMKCENLMSHAPKWNTTNNWSTNGIEPPNANESYANEVEHDKCPQCNFETSWKEGDSLQKTDAEREMSSHIKDKHGESYAGEGRSEDLKREIKEKEDFIRLASLENPMNMGEFENELVDLKDELAMVGATEEQEVETGWLDPDTGELVQERPKKLHTIDSVRRLEGEEEEEEPETEEEELRTGYDAELERALDDELTQKLASRDSAKEEDVELVPDKGKFLNMMGDMQAPPEKAEEQEVECEDCGEKFNDSAQLEEHQYANWHGKHKDDYEGQDMPRNVMGGY